MAVSGIGSDPSVVLTGQLAGVEVSSPAAAAAVAEVAPRELPALAQDAFNPAEPGAALPDLAGGGGAEAAVIAARQDLRAAKRELRHARNESGPQGKVDRMVAHQDVRAARQDLAAAKEAAATEAAGLPGSRDTFTGAAPPSLVLDVLRGEAGPGRGLALGHELPAISQLHPEGEAEGYSNAEMNCGPAAMAMVARGIPGGMLDGKPVAQMSDAELINRLGAHGQTNAEGTSPNGVIAMAEQMGMATSSRMGGFDAAYYDSVLAQGGTVVANGARDIEGQLAGHFVVVTAKTADGNYLVNDPWSGRTETYTPAQLDAFLLANPVNGGVSIGMV